MEALMEFIVTVTLHCSATFLNPDEPRKSFGSCLIATALCVLLGGAIAFGSGMALSPLLMGSAIGLCAVAIVLGLSLIASS